MSNFLTNFSTILFAKYVKLYDILKENTVCYNEDGQIKVFLKEIIGLNMSKIHIDIMGGNAMKRIISILLATACALTLSGMPCAFAAELKGDYTVTITECAEDNGAVSVKGAISPSLAYGLKLTIKDGDDVKHTAETTSLADGSFTFPAWTAPESNKDITYSVSVAPINPAPVFDGGWSLSDDFSSAPTTTSYTVATTSWEADGYVKAQSGTSRARLIKDFNGARSSGVAVIEVDVMKKEKSVSSRLFRSMDGNGTYAAFTVSATANDIVAKAGDGSVTLTLVKDYETEKWYTLKTVNDISAMRTEFYVNGEYKGVLSYKGYNDSSLNKIYRVFDTSSEVGDGAHYIDNLSIKHGTTTRKWVDGAATDVLIYRSTLTNEVVSAVDKATKDTLWNDLQAFPEIGLDASLLDKVNDKTAAAELMLTGNNNSIGAIKQNYCKCIMLERIKEAPQNTAQIINEAASGAGLTISTPVSDADMLVTIIKGAANDFTSFNAFDTLLEKGALLSELTVGSAAFTAVQNNEKLLIEKYALSEEYLLLSDGDRQTAVAAAGAYVYSNDAIDEALKKAVALINEKAHALIQNVPTIAGDYTVTVEECTAVGNTVKLRGNIGVKAQYKLSVEITADGQTAYTKEIQSKADGTFEHECTLPTKKDNTTYDVSISPVEPTVIYQTEHSDDFSEETSGNYLVYRGVDKDADKGNEKPSIKVSYEATDAQYPRILLSSESLRNKTAGEVVISADILKTDKANSDNIISSMEYTGNHTAYTVKADKNKIYATAPSGELVLVPNYATDKWYTLRINADLGGKRLSFYVNDIYRGMLSYKAKASEITNLGRVFDTSETTLGNSHYADNVYVLSGTYSTDKYSIDSAKTTVLVYGSDYMAEALKKINEAAPEALRAALDTYNGVLQLDLGIFDKLGDGTSAARLFKTKNYTSVNDVRTCYVKSVMVQALKEDKTQLKSILTTYAADSNTDVGAIKLDSKVFSDVVNATLDSAGTLDDFDVLLKKAEIASNLLDSTKLTVGGVFEGYSTLLAEKYALSADYKTLDPSEKKDEAAGAILDLTYTDFNAHTLLSQIVGAVNTKIADIKNNASGDGSTQTPATPSYTGGGGGGGGKKPAAPQTTEATEASSAAGNRFIDVGEEHWAYAPIVYLADIGIINGKGEGEFAPDDTVKREELVKILVLAGKMSLTSEKIEFDDIPADSWFAPYVSTAIKNGMISGMGDRKFGSGIGVTRQDAAVMIKRALGGALSDDEEAIAAFTDAEQISDYAREAVSELVKNGIISGMGDGSFMPNEMLTRAQAAQLVFKAFCN